MSSHKFENDNHTPSEHHTEENENHDGSSSEQHTQENGSDDHNLSTANPGIQGNGSLEKIIAASLQNTTGVNAMSSNELENHDNASSAQHTHDNETDNHTLSATNSGIQGISPLGSSIDDSHPINNTNTTGNSTIRSNELESHDSNASSEQHTQEEGDKDAEGYEYHYTSATNREIHGNKTVGNVIKGSDSDDLLYGGNVNDVLDGGNGNDRLEGSDGDDILIGGGHADEGENHLNGGDGDDILVAGGSKTSQLDQFLSDHQDIVNSVKSNQKLTDVASIINSVTNNSGNGVHNIFDVHSGSGHDQIFNFHAATDKVQLDRGLNGSDISDINSLLHHIHISGNDLSIDLGGGNSITLVGVDVSGLTANNVAFA